MDAQRRSVFREPWWLDAVAPGTWGEVVVGAGDGDAHLAWQVQRDRLGLVRVTTPPLTRLGPWTRPQEGSSAAQLSREKRLMARLIDGLPRADLCQLTFTTDVINWLPFHWAGFTSSSRITYVLPDLSDEQVIWRSLTDKARNAVRKADARLSVRDDLGAEALARLVGVSLSRRGAGLDPGLIRRVHDAVVAHEAGRALFAVDGQGRPVGGVLVAWDGGTAYYLLSGADESGRRAGAQSLLLWEAIRLAATKVGRFDFEGSMLEAVEPLFRAFGGEQVPYLVVERCSRRYSALRAGRGLAASVLR